MLCHIDKKRIIGVGELEICKSTIAMAVVNHTNGFETVIVGIVLQTAQYRSWLVEPGGRCDTT